MIPNYIKKAVKKDNIFIIYGKPDKAFIDRDLERVKDSRQYNDYTNTGGRLGVNDYNRIKNDVDKYRQQLSKSIYKTVYTWG